MSAAKEQAKALIEELPDDVVQSVPADESAVLADGSVLKHASAACFSGLAPAETDASAFGSAGFLQSHFLRETTRMGSNS